MLNKVLDSKKKKIVFYISLSLAVLILALLCARSFRRVQYQVRVASVIYDKYISGKSFAKLPFTFVRESDTSSTKVHFFGRIPVTAATITYEKNIPLVTEPCRVDCTVYPLSSSYILPTVDADFSKMGTKDDSVFSPKLSVGFSTDGTVKSNTRALPVDGVYAGQEGYALNVTRSAVCTVYVEKIKADLNLWCEKNFTDEKIKSSKKSADVNSTSSSNNNNSSKQKAVFVFSVGDIMVARGTQDILLNDKDGLKKVFTSTLPVLQNNDIAIGNLEGVVTSSSKNAIKTYTFKFKKDVLPVLQKAGFTYLMQTNNHSYDFGEDGFKDSLDAFKEYNVPSSGVGHNIEEAKKFYHTEINGQKFAIISCGAYPVENSGFNGNKTATATQTRAGILWLTDEVYDLVRKEKADGNFVIVNVHGGEEYHFEPNKTQVSSYRKLCDSGADVVFGSHPHVLQKNEWYKNSLIVYSQGNFLFNGMQGMNGATESEIVRLGVLNGRIAYCEVYPAKLGSTSVSLK